MRPQTICSKLNAARPRVARGYVGVTTLQDVAHAPRSAEKVHLLCRKACEDASVDPATLPIVVEELSLNRSTFESEFAQRPRNRPRFTSPGIESRASGLSARGPPSCPRHVRGAAGRQSGKPTPGLPVEGEMLAGARFIELSVHLAKHRFDRWADWVPGRTLWPKSDRARRGIRSFPAPWAGSCAVDSRTMS
jgi:hypothetical protein